MAFKGVVTSWAGDDDHAQDGADFEDTVEVNEPAELLEKSLDHRCSIGKRFRFRPALPSRYRDQRREQPEHIGIYGQSLNVPEFQDEKLGLHRLFWRVMNIVSSQQIGNGNFIISNISRPRFQRTRKRRQHQAHAGPEFLASVL